MGLFIRLPLIDRLRNYELHTIVGQMTGIADIFNELQYNYVQ
jgi:hypothetical protein